MSNEGTKRSDQVIDDARRLVHDAREARVFESIYRENPYLVVAAAAGLGYVAAGGLPSPFTRRLLKIGMKALFVPIAASQLKEIAVGVQNAQTNETLDMER